MTESIGYIEIFHDENLLEKDIGTYLFLIEEVLSVFFEIKKTTEEIKEKDKELFAYLFEKKINIIILSKKPEDSPPQIISVKTSPSEYSPLHISAEDIRKTSRLLEIFFKTTMPNDNSSNAKKTLEDIDFCKEEILVKKTESSLIKKYNEIIEEKKFQIKTNQENALNILKEIKGVFFVNGDLVINNPLFFLNSLSKIYLSKNINLKTDPRIKSLDLSDIEKISDKWLSEETITPFTIFDNVAINFCGKNYFIIHYIFLFFYLKNKNSHVENGIRPFDETIPFFLDENGRCPLTPKSSKEYFHLINLFENNSPERDIDKLEKLFFPSNYFKYFYIWGVNAEIKKTKYAYALPYLPLSSVLVENTPENKYSFIDIGKLTKESTLSIKNKSFPKAFISSQEKIESKKEHLKKEIKLIEEIIEEKNKIMENFLFSFSVFPKNDKNEAISFSKKRMMAKSIIVLQQLSGTSSTIKAKNVKEASYLPKAENMPPEYRDKILKKIPSSQKKYFAFANLLSYSQNKETYCESMQALFSNKNEKTLTSITLAKETFENKHEINLSIGQTEIGMNDKKIQIKFSDTLEKSSYMIISQIEIVYPTIFFLKIPDNIYFAEINIEKTHGRPNSENIISNVKIFEIETSQKIYPNGIFLEKSTKDNGAIFTNNNINLNDLLKNFFDNIDSNKLFREAKKQVDICPICGIKLPKNILITDHVKTNHSKNQPQNIDNIARITCFLKIEVYFSKNNHFQSEKDEMVLALQDNGIGDIKNEVEKKSYFSEKNKAIIISEFKNICLLDISIDCFNKKIFLSIKEEESISILNVYFETIYGQLKNEFIEEEEEEEEEEENTPGYFPFLDLENYHETKDILTHFLFEMEIEIKENLFSNKKYEIITKIMEKRGAESKTEITGNDPISVSYDESREMSFSEEEMSGEIKSKEKESLDINSETILEQTDSKPTLIGMQSVLDGNKEEENKDEKTGSSKQETNISMSKYDLEKIKEMKIFIDKQIDMKISKLMTFITMFSKNIVINVEIINNTHVFLKMPQITDKKIDNKKASEFNIGIEDLINIINQRIDLFNYNEKFEKGKLIIELKEIKVPIKIEKSLVHQKESNFAQKIKEDSFIFSFEKMYFESSLTNSEIQSTDQINNKKDIGDLIEEINSEANNNSEIVKKFIIEQKIRHFDIKKINTSLVSTFNTKDLNRFLIGLKYSKQTGRINQLVKNGKIFQEIEFILPKETPRNEEIPIEDNLLMKPYIATENALERHLKEINFYNAMGICERNNIPEFFYAESNLLEKKISTSLFDINNKIIESLYAEYLLIKLVKNNFLPLIKSIKAIYEKTEFLNTNPIDEIKEKIREKMSKEDNSTTEINSITLFEPKEEPIKIEEINMSLDYFYNKTLLSCHKNFKQDNGLKKLIAENLFKIELIFVKNKTSERMIDLKYMHFSQIYVSPSKILMRKINSLTEDVLTEETYLDKLNKLREEYNEIKDIVEEKEYETSYSISLKEKINKDGLRHLYKTNNTLLDVFEEKNNMLIQNTYRGFLLNEKQ